MKEQLSGWGQQIHRLWSCDWYEIFDKEDKPFPTKENKEKERVQYKRNN